MWRQVLERPLDVLVRGELAGEGGRLLAAHAQDAVVGGQHAAVEEHHLLVVVVGQDVVEGDVLGHHGVLHHQAHVLRTVHTHVVPEGKQRLLVVVGGDGRLRQFGLKNKRTTTGNLNIYITSRIDTKYFVNSKSEMLKSNIKIKLSPL